MTAIVADAIGDPMDHNKPENGYYTWARFGFNNALDSDLPKFTERLVALDDRLQALPGERGVLGGLAAALAPGSTAAALSPGEKATRQLELKNRKVFEHGLSVEDQAELDYLTKFLEVAELERELATYRGPLDWFIAHCDEIRDLNDLFLKAPDGPVRTQMATLWRGFGSTLTEACFDLGEDSRSNQVLVKYLQDRGLG